MPIRWETVENAVVFLTSLDGWMVVSLRRQSRYPSLLKTQNTITPQTKPKFPQFLVSQVVPDPPIQQLKPRLASPQIPRLLLTDFPLCFLGRAERQPKRSSNASSGILGSWAVWTGKPGIGTMALQRETPTRTEISSPAVLTSRAYTIRGRPGGGVLLIY
jgi:hypothetical protein